jgi:hypothetical protein
VCSNCASHLSRWEAGDRHAEVPAGHQGEAGGLSVVWGARERGDISQAAFRLFKADGTWEDIVIGTATEEERENALRVLPALLDQAH